MKNRRPLYLSTTLRSDVERLDRTANEYRDYLLLVLSIVFGLILWWIL